jgi:glucokinase
MGAVLAVDLGGTKCHSLLVGGDGTILHEDYRPTRQRPRAEDVLLEAIDALHGVARLKGATVVATAIGIPALIDPTAGLVVGGINLGWDRFDLQALLDSRLTEPYVLDNDVNLAAIGEATVGAGRGAHSFVTVALGTGLGGAVVVDGTILRGHDNAAGEIGYLMASRRQLRHPGLLAMESLIGGWSIAARAREAARRNAPGSRLDVDGLSAAEVFVAAEDGDETARDVLNEVLEYVAMTVIDITALLNPERVILDGGVGRALAPYVPRIRELVAPSVLVPPDLRVSTLTPNSTLAGAVIEARRVAGARAASAEVRPGS